MENLEQKFNQAVADAKRVSLFPQEKEQVRQNVLAFMKEYVPGKETPKPWYATFAALVTPHGAVKYSYVSLASLLVVMLFGGSVSYAAQFSLPGDLLYPVKTRVNERVLAWSKISTESQAKYEIGLVQLRLEEIEKVSTKNTLDEKTGVTVRSLIGNHVAQAKSKIEKIEQEGNADASVEAGAELEASLHAHAEVLQKLQVGATGSVGAAAAAKTSSPLDGIVSDIKEKAQAYAKFRQEKQVKTGAQPNAASKVSAEKKLAQASVQLQESTDLIEARKNEISAESYEKAKADLISAQGYFNQATEKMASQEYSSAFVLFQDSMRTALQVEIFVKTESNLPLPKGAFLEGMVNIVTNNVIDTNILP